MKNMKNVLKMAAGAVIGAGVMFVSMKSAEPFEYDYNKEESTVTITAENIVSDYETLERNFDGNESTFKIYFEQE